VQHSTAQQSQIYESNMMYTHDSSQARLQSAASTLYLNLKHTCVQSGMALKRSAVVKLSCVALLHPLSVNTYYGICSVQNWYIQGCKVCIMSHSHTLLLIIKNHTLLLQLLLLNC
jgi:hypothetical protein